MYDEIVAVGWDEVAAIVAIGCWRKLVDLLNFVVDGATPVFDDENWPAEFAAICFV